MKNAAFFVCGILVAVAFAVGAQVGGRVEQLHAHDLYLTNDSNDYAGRLFAITTDYPANERRFGMLFTGSSMTMGFCEDSDNCGTALGINRGDGIETSSVSFLSETITLQSTVNMTLGDIGTNINVYGGMNIPAYVDDVAACAAGMSANQMYRDSDAAQGAAIVAVVSC